MANMSFKSKGKFLNGDEVCDKCHLSRHIRRQIMGSCGLGSGTLMTPGFEGEAGGKNPARLIIR